eukprot:scaffold5708_cov378-Prasinococcus_capsulatus_cf.AAC.4
MRVWARALQGQFERAAALPRVVVSLCLDDPPPPPPSRLGSEEDRQLAQLRIFIITILVSAPPASRWKGVAGRAPLPEVGGAHHSRRNVWREEARGAAHVEARGGAPHLPLLDACAAAPAAGDPVQSRRVDSLPVARASEGLQVHAGTAAPLSRPAARLHARRWVALRSAASM